MAGAYIPNGDFEEEMERSSDSNGLVGAAELAAERAQAIAPRRSGDYADSIEAGVDPDGNVILTASDFKAIWIEFGTTDTPIFAPLRRGVIAAGLRFQSEDR